jgi:hypothetical protein
MRYLNTATQQSVTEAQVRQSFPDVSLPEFLPDSIGDFVRIVETPQPNYDQTTHRIIDGGLVVADGKATRNWIIEPLPSEEVEIRITLNAARYTEIYPVATSEFPNN